MTDLRDGDALKAFQEGLRVSDEGSQQKTAAVTKRTEDQVVVDVRRGRLVNLTFTSQQSGDEVPDEVANELSTDLIKALGSPELTTANEKCNADPECQVGPIDSEYYVVKEVANAEKLDKQADELFKTANDTDQEGDKHGLITVILALALFLYGVAAVASAKRLKLSFAAMGFTIFIVSLGCSRPYSRGVRVAPSAVRAGRGSRARRSSRSRSTGATANGRTRREKRSLAVLGAPHGVDVAARVVDAGISLHGHRDLPVQSRNRRSRVGRPRPRIGWHRSGQARPYGSFPDQPRSLLMAVRSGNAEWKGDLPMARGTLVVGDGVFKGNYTFKSRFEEGEGTNPEELIAAAHASCYAMAFANMLAEAGPPDSIKTSARVGLRNVDGAPTIAQIDLKVEGACPASRTLSSSHLAAQAKEACPVSRALAGVNEINLEASLG